MNNKLLKGALSAMAFGAGSLFAAETVTSFNPYVEVKGAFVKPAKRENIKYKNGYMAAVEFGVAYDSFRLGMEASYRQAKVKDAANGAKIKVPAVMINAYYDYALTDEAALYAGLGLGVAHYGSRVDTETMDSAKFVFAWQVMAGVSYDINENWTVAAGYRLFNTAKVKVAANKKVKTPFMHAIELGLRYSF